MHLDAPSYCGPPIEGMLVVTEPLGSDTLCWFDVGAHRLSARLQPRRARGLNGRQQLYFDLGKASVFSSETQRRL